MCSGIKYSVLFLLPLLIVGCNKVDTDDLRKNIDVSNRRIESMMQDYNTSKFKATKFYEATLDYLSGKSNRLEVKDMDSYYIEEFTSTLDSYKAVIMEMYEDDKVFREEKGMGVSTLEDFIKTDSLSHYFLNESNATLEQDILYKLPYGKVLGIQIEWLGGDIFGFQTYTND